MFRVRGCSRFLELSANKPYIALDNRKIREQPRTKNILPTSGLNLLKESRDNREMKVRNPRSSSSRRLRASNLPQVQMERVEVILSTGRATTRCPTGTRRLFGLRA
jgi:hypothetical protein